MSYYKMTEHMKIQSIIFNKDDWSEKIAKRWLVKHGYTVDFKGKGTDETSSSYRFRQAEPLTKSQKREGYFYITKHSDKPKEEGIAFVVICEPKKDITHTKKKVRAPRQDRVIDVGDQLVVELSRGMFNMPMELRSSIGIIRDGDPLRNLPHEAGHHPTLETARALDKNLFGHLAMQNY